MFGVNSVPYLSFFGTLACPNFVSGLLPRHLFNRFLNRILDAWGSECEVFLCKVLQKQIFAEIVFYGFWDVCLLFFGSFGTVFQVFAGLERGLKIDGLLAL